MEMKKNPCFFSKFFKSMYTIYISGSPTSQDCFGKTRITKNINVPNVKLWYPKFGEGVIL
jgi:hypothetical protein